jgi:hypothetical protein
MRSQRYHLLGPNDPDAPCGSWTQSFPGANASAVSYAGHRLANTRFDAANAPRSEHTVVRPSPCERDALVFHSSDRVGRTGSG